MSRWAPSGWSLRHLSRPAPKCRALRRGRRLCPRQSIIPVKSSTSCCGPKILAAMHGGLIIIMGRMAPRALAPRKRTPWAPCGLIPRRHLCPALCRLRITICWPQTTNSSRSKWTRAGWVLCWATLAIWWAVVKVRGTWWAAWWSRLATTICNCSLTSSWVTWTWLIK